MLIPGTQLGSYQIVDTLGVGGMGEVYRATDTKLKRQVAIKTLPSSLAADPERLARFQREAEVLAALNHPHIAAVYGLEEAAGVKGLVMELVEGPTLADRLTRGPLPVDEALAIARQIAEALEAAHEQGIVHRDLKPANVKVRQDGTVKVLDFGLAKALEPAGGEAASGVVENSPTITSPALTMSGVILGTAAYMSPEQARGKPLDKRTDIWSFGCVLYEMLTGRRAFTGDDVSDVVASILAREPDLTLLPAGLPASMRRLLERCFHKNRQERLRDVGDARLEIRDALARTTGDAAPVETRRGRERLAWMATVVAMGVALAASLMSGRRSQSTLEQMRFDIVTPPTAVPLSIAISPDGRTLAYVATSEGQSRLWLRSIETGTTRALTGTEGATAPFWSPDSRSIGLFAAGSLKRVEVDGGAVQTLTDAPVGQSGTWNRDGVILYASLGMPIQRIAASGGDSAAVTALAQPKSQFFPYFLPDGRRFLYHARGTPDVRGVYVGQLDQALPARRLVDADAGAVYASSGHLLFASGGTLFAQPFDADRLEMTGTPVTVAEIVASVGDGPGISVSSSGSIVFRERTARTQRQFVWFDRSGQDVGRVGEPVTTTLSGPSLSSDGQRVAFYRGAGANPDIWLLETKRGAFSRFTSDPADDIAPVWSPRDDRIVFSSNRGGVHDLYEKSVAGGRSEELLLSTPQQKGATDWSRDGRFLLYYTQDPKAGFDIWALPMDGDRKPFPVARTNFREFQGQFSPDTKWVAYQSDESGRQEIYIQPFPGPGSKWPVSAAGGSQVRWSRDGKELFYVDPDSRLMSVATDMRSNLTVPDIGTPVPLFTLPLGGSVQQGDFRYQYMVSADGQRFLVAAVTQEAPTPISVILNWAAGARP